MTCPSRPTANTSAKSISSRLAAFVLIAAAQAAAAEWVDSKPVMYRGNIAMTYRAQLVGDWLIVEANHGAEWHSYAMDNIERAKKATGKETPETELPTKIEIAGGLKAVGAWKQTDPADLSKLDIQWYSWGFHGTARFAVKIERTGGADATITINAQSCNATSCSMVRDLKITVPVPAEKSGDPAELLKGLIDVPAK